MLERGLMNAEDLAKVLDLEKMSAMPEYRAVETAPIQTKPASAG